MCGPRRDRGNLARVVTEEVVDPVGGFEVGVLPGGPLVELNAAVVTTRGEASDRIGVFRDVTEREEREDTLRAQNDRLEGFAETITHDLRNPLSIAQGHLEFVDAPPDDANLGAVVQAHDRMEQLIDELLTLVRERHVVLEPAQVSLSEVAWTEWQHTATGNATLTVDTDDVLFADPGRSSEHLENLFRNAVEHGGDAVGVAVGALPDAPGFYVEDDGPGIREADRESVFEAGYTTTDGGAGFGLSIGRQIVEGHGWRVAVTESETGSARFEFSGVESPKETE